MFTNPSVPGKSFDEGTVVQVDPIRGLCKVRTLRGKILQEVQALSSHGGSNRGADRSTPSMGDRVVVNYDLGYPVIFGFLPKMQTDDGAQPLSLFSGQEQVDTGSYSPGSTTHGDKNKPKDFVAGDRVISSIGGALLGLLRGGALILRSSKSSEIFMSGLDGLVRVMSRNWAHFSDASSDVIRNFKGKLYRYTGYAKTFSESKVEDYKLHFYYGDVKAAETVKTNYGSYTGTPSSDPVLYKEQVTGVAGTPAVSTSGSVVGEYYRRTLSSTGEEEVLINNGSHIVRLRLTAEQALLTWNNQNQITITEASVRLVHKDGAEVILDSSKVRAVFGGSTALLESGQATVTNGAGTLLVSPSLTKIQNGGHSVSVTAGGVAIS